MTSKRVLWLGVPLAAIAVAVAAGSAPAGASSAPQTLRVTLERGACFGACPIYTITLRGNGDAVYVGRRHVSVVGTRRAHLSRAAIRRLRNGVAQARVFTLRNRYDSLTVTDLPYAVVTIRVGSRTKRIYHYFGDQSAPERLETLECLVDRIARSSRWVGRDMADFCRSPL
jgi:Domain of unknown function (DUF6438)